MTLHFNAVTGRHEGDAITVASALMERCVRDALARGEREDVARARLS